MLLTTSTRATIFRMNLKLIWIIALRAQSVQIQFALAAGHKYLVWEVRSALHCSGRLECDSL